jgi:hypothetical protein
MHEGARIAPEFSSQEFVDAIAAVNEGIGDPVDKLRFLRTSLNLYPGHERVIRRIPWSHARRWLAQLLSFAVLQRCLRCDAHAPLTSVRIDTLQAMVRARTIAAVTLTMLCAAMILLALRVAPEAPYGSTSASIAGAIDAKMRMDSAQRAVASEIPAAQLPAAEPIAPLTASEVAANIWLVDEGQGWELYSNGLRIETAFEVAGEPRKYLVFAAEHAEPVATETHPVGILLHTSESDLWPLEAEFNSNIRSSTRGLLRYVQRLKLYNYVIDRFGRVYRIVKDDTRAHHAGHGIWSYNDRYYLNLNSAMIGLCFETRWNGGRALPITEAQLLAGRSLTALLRQRYSIAPDMVVAHGLTSVSSKSHLIGHHLDWARGFPFEAFGLPNQYEREPPSVAFFGFRYDAKFLAQMGEPWPGLKQAELTLAAEAKELGITLRQLRARKQAQFDAWLRIQTRGDQAITDSNDPHTAAKAASTQQTH